MEPVESLTLQERVYRELKHLLMTGHFAPGEVLTIRSLADAMGTSVMPVREALQRLAADQALIVLPNRSIRVPVMRRANLLEIMEIRMRMEGLATEMATESISEDEIARLEQLQNENSQAYEGQDPGRLFETNYRFHFAIYEAADTSFLFSIIEGLWLRMGPIFKIPLEEWPKLKEPLGVARGNHVQIIKALRDRDAAAAGEHMRDDVRASVQLFLDHAPLETAEVAPQ